MIPMCIEEFLFVSGAPSEKVLLDHLCAELGAHASARFDAIEITDNRVRLTSQDVTALACAAKVCRYLGGEPRARGTDSR